MRRLFINSLSLLFVFVLASFFVLAYPLTPFSPQASAPVITHIYYPSLVGVYSITVHVQDGDQDVSVVNASLVDPLGRLIFNNSLPLSSHNPGSVDYFYSSPRINFSVPGVWSLNVSVVDALGLSSFESVSFSVSPLPNQPPVILTDSLPDAVEDSPYYFFVNASDPEGDSLVFSDDSPYFDIDPVSGLISFVPDQSLVDISPISFTISVSDNYSNVVSRFFSLNIINKVEDPYLDLPSSVSFPEDSVFSLNLADYVNESDVPVNQIVFSASGNNHVSVSFAPDSAVAYFTPDPDWSGSELITITASNPSLGKVSSPLADQSVAALGFDTILVNVTPVPDPAVWSSSVVRDLSVTEDSAPFVLYSSLKSLCSDPDEPFGEPLVFSASSSEPSNLDVSFEPNGDDLLVSFLRPDFNTLNRQPVVVTVSCNDASLDLRVSVLPSNDPPVFSSLPSQSLFEDSSLFEAFDLNSFVSDPDGDSLSFSVVNGSLVGGVVDSRPDGSNVLLLSVLQPDAFGSDTLYVSASDGVVSVSAPLSVQVLPVDDPAVWSPLPVLRVSEDSPDGFVLLSGVSSFCSDVDSPVVVSLSSWLNLNYSLSLVDDDLLIFGLPQDYFDVAGSLVFFDCNGVSSSTSLFVDPVNDAPVFSGFSGSLSVTENEVFDIQFFAADPDNDPLVFSLVSGPGSVSPDGHYSWVTSSADVGSHMINVSVSDGSLSDYFSLNLDVVSRLSFLDVSFENLGSGLSLSGLSDGDSLGDVRPGDSLLINSTVLNDLPDRLSDVVATLSFDSFSVSSQPVNILPGANRSFSLVLDVPLLGVVEGDKVLSLSVSGVTPDGKVWSVSNSFDFVLRKDPRNVFFSRVSLVPDSLSCVRSSVVDLVVANAGSLDESNANLSLSVPGSGFSYNEVLFVPAGSSVSLSVPVSFDQSLPAGSYPLVVSVSYDNGDGFVVDNLHSFSVSDCSLPVIGPFSEDEVLSSPLLVLDDFFADSYHDNLSYSVSAPASLLSCSVSSGELYCSLVPDAFGSSVLNLSVLDVDSGYSFNVSLPFVVSSVNDAPVLSFPSSFSFVEDSSLSINLSDYVFDVDNSFSDLSWSVSSSSPDVFVSVVGDSLLLSSSPDWFGSAVINVSVVDSFGASDNSSFVVSVVSAGNDDSPVFVSSVPSVFDIAMPEDVGFVEPFSVVVSDPDGSGSLVADWFVDSVLVSSSPVVGNVSSFDFIADGSVGNHTVSVNVSDGVHSVGLSWLVEVRDTPRSRLYVSPIFSLNASEIENVSSFSISSADGNTIISFDEGQYFNLSRVVDFDRFVLLRRGVAGIDTSRFFVFAGANASVLFSGLSFDKEPLLYYQPGFGVFGGSVCSSSVCSSLSWDDSFQSFSFHVNGFSTFWLVDNPLNLPPVILSDPVVEARVGESYYYSVVASDPEGDSLSYSLSVAPDGMVIDPVSGVISWSPSVVGDFNVTVVVSDNNSNVVSQSFVVSVLPPVKLLFKNVKLFVNDASEGSLRSGKSFDVAPADVVLIEGDVLNDFARSSGVSINDVEVELLVDGFDDGSSLSESESLGDIRADKQESFSFSFEVPYSIDEDSYDASLTVFGVDDDGFEHVSVINFSFDLSKEDEAVLIRDFSVSPSVVSCDRVVSFSSELLNIGLDDLDLSVSFEVPSLSLVSSSSLSLDAGDDPYSVSGSLFLPLDAPVGSYDALINVYSGSSLLASDSVLLKVLNCSGSGVSPEPVLSVPSVVSSPAVSSPFRVVRSVPSSSVVFDYSFEYLLLLIVLFVLLLSLLVYSVAYLYFSSNKKRRKRVVPPSTVKKSSVKSSRSSRRK